MLRRVSFALSISAFIQCILSMGLPSISLAQEWLVRGRQQGTIRVVDLRFPSASAQLNCAEGLITLDHDNNWCPCLAEDWRWIDDRTMEFKLRRGVTFHNGEKFDAEAVRINWHEYRRMEHPRIAPFLELDDETIFEIIDEYTVRFTFPEPDALACMKFLYFYQLAPAFFSTHEFDEKCQGYFPKPGPWGSGPFRLVEGIFRFGRPAKRMVLEAYEDYWDRRYPRLRKVIFDNGLIGDRKEAMRLCRETEGAVDIVSHIRPLDTLKVAESEFAKVVKSRQATTLSCWINLHKSKGKWRDIRLRKALNYAVNRKELWRYAAKGNAHNLGGYIPPGAHGHKPHLSLYTYDPARARALLVEAGYPNGFEVKIIAAEAWKLEAQIISKMLERIGLRVILDVLTVPEYMRKVYIPILDKAPEEQDWDLCLEYNAESLGHSAASFLAFGFIKEGDLMGVDSDLVYERMWKDMAGTLDPESQAAKIRAMEQYIYEHAYRLFIYSPITLYAANKDINVGHQDSWWLRLKEISVTDNHWSVRAKSLR